MIKTLSINLGGIVFQIDEDAYEALRRYLDTITRYYKYTEGRDEIVTDIEARLSELFTERQQRSGYSVISMGDIEEVIEVMGRPEDFDDEGDRFGDEPRPGDGRDSSRRLYRDTEDGVLAGVCSGLAAYWGVKDPLWIRLGFIATALFSAFTLGVIIYIILWIVVPEARTSAQKLEMRGEPVNVSNLEKKIRESITDAGEGLRDFANSERNNHALRSLVNGIGRVFGAVAKLLLVVVKIFVVLLIAVLIGALIITLLASLFSFLIAIPVSLKYIFAGPIGWLMALIGGLLVLVIPLAYLVYLPFRIFGKRRITNRNVRYTAVGLFMTGVVLCFAAGTLATSYFSERETVTTRVIVPHPENDTLHLALNSNEESMAGLDHHLTFMSLLSFTKKLETASDWVELDILPGNDDEIVLETTYQSRGRNKRYAKRNASDITYNIDLIENGVRFDPVFGLGERRKWRSQTVKLKLMLPEGLVITPGHDMAAILDDVANTENAGVYTVAGNSWRMADRTLEPVDSVLNGSTWAIRNQRRVSYTGFDALDISGDVDVEFRQGPTHEVYISNGSRSREVEFDLDGTTLVIDGEDFSWNRIDLWFLNHRHQVDPKVYITLPKISRISAGGTSYVFCDHLRGESLSIYAHGQASVILENLDIRTMEAELHGQSDLTISGIAGIFMLDASAQADLDGEEFRAGKLMVDMGGQSDAEMMVDDLIEGELHGQSDLGYWGHPDVNVSTYAQSAINSND